MPIRTQSAAPFRARFPKPAGDARPPDLRGRVEAEAEPLVTQLELATSSDEAKLNKLEKAWLAVLRERGADWIGIEPFGLKLAAQRCRYHPDFVVLKDGQLTAFETKGPHFFDDAKVKLKVAAHEYPFIRFVLVTRENGQWKETVIKP